MALKNAELPPHLKIYAPAVIGDVAQSKFSNRVASKRLVSRVLAALLLVPTLPIIGLLVLLVRWTSPGPGIYRQRRVGYRGQEFVILKIRTMRQDAEAATGPVWATKNDNRSTRFGKFLRRSHLDELPQLFNVLRGEMCLVGPRPERPEIVAGLKTQLPGYLDRLSVPPGIAGLAQVRQGGDVDLDSVRRKLSYDIAYIRNMRTIPLVDFRILAATALLVLGVSRTNSLKLCGLASIQPIAVDDSSVEMVRKAA